MLNSQYTFKMHKITCVMEDDMAQNEDRVEICEHYCGECPKCSNLCQKCFFDAFSTSCEANTCAADLGLSDCYQCDNFPCDKWDVLYTELQITPMNIISPKISGLRYTQNKAINHWMENKATENMCCKCGKLTSWASKNTSSC